MPVEGTTDEPEDSRGAQPVTAALEEDDGGKGDSDSGHDDGGRFVEGGTQTDSDELSDVLGPLRPTKLVREKRARELREAQIAAAQPREGGADIFANRSFKQVRNMQRWPLQPLWPADTHGSMQPISEMATPIRRGVRPRSDGRPGSMIDVQSTMAKIMDCTRNSDTQEVDHEVIGSYPDVLSDARGTQLLSRGGKHLSELNLQGLDSSIVRLGTAKDDEMEDRHGVVVRPAHEGSAVALVNRGVKVSKEQRQGCRMRGPDEHERMRHRMASDRCGQSNLRVSNWRGSGAFAPREVEKLTMLNIERAAKLQTQHVEKLALRWSGGGQALLSARIGFEVGAPLEGSVYLGRPPRLEPLERSASTTW